ncbi:MAG: murein biosynthesis integral membrane protein MurJ, partial [Candidatus Competibacterales bacterium]
PGPAGPRGPRPWGGRWGRPRGGGGGGAPWLVDAFASGFRDQPEQYALAVELLRLTFPYLLFISLTALAGGILNSCGRFAVPALTPVGLNLCLMAALGWAWYSAATPAEAAWLLALGVLLAGVVQLAFQVPFLHREGLLPRPVWGAGHPGVRRIVTLMVPTLFGASVTQLNVLINTHLASYLVAGSVSWLYYADRLLEFPLGLLGVALGTVILPQLSKDHATTDPKGFTATLDWGLRWALAVGIPAAVGLALLAVPVLATLFQRGSFGAEDVLMTAGALVVYAGGLVPFMAIKVLLPGFYARQDTATPVRIATLAVVVNLATGLLLIGPLAHVGLALATSLAAVVNAGLLYHQLQRRGVYRPSPGFWPLVGRLGVAASVMALGLVIVAGEARWWLEANLGAQLAWLLGLIAGGALVYGVTALALGVRWRHLER